VVPDDPVFVDSQRDRDGSDLEQIQRIDENRPVHLLPLHEEAAAVRVLLLDNPDHLELALLLQLLGCFVPPGHVPAAARSPGSKDVEQEFAAAKLAD